MDDRELRLIHPPRTPEQRKLVPDQVFGVLMAVMSETMMFAGLVSAFVIAKTNYPIWPPPGQPRLPIEATAFNTAALLASGLCMVWAGRAYAAGGAQRALRPMLASFLLGAFFVLFQGWEWLGLIGEGLTMLSGASGAFFYLIVGLHALHAVAGLIAVGWMYRRLTDETLTAGGFQAGRIFWYFVVTLWPFLYWQVYL